MKEKKETPLEEQQRRLKEEVKRQKQLEERPMTAPPVKKRSKK